MVIGQWVNLARMLGKHGGSRYNKTGITKFSIAMTEITF